MWISGFIASDLKSIIDFALLLKSRFCKILDEKTWKWGTWRKEMDGWKKKEKRISHKNAVLSTFWGLFFADKQKRVWNTSEASLIIIHLNGTKKSANQSGKTLKNLEFQFMSILCTFPQLTNKMHLWKKNLRSIRKKSGW